MDGDDEDPDSVREPMHPSVFYGFWPRFRADGGAAEHTDAEPSPSGAD